MKDCKSAWKKKSENNEKPWGTETAWSSMATGIHGKILYLKKGERTSLKYFNLKNETLFMMSGSANIYYGDEASLYDEINHPFCTTSFSPGDTFYVQSECPYRIAANEDCQIIEIGTYSQEKPTRISDDYGRAK
jgi:uncharacterized RmlC-like cupin family protein